MLCYITRVMLYNTHYDMLYNKCYDMLCYITNAMLYNT